MSQLVSAVITALDGNPNAWTCDGYDLQCGRTAVWIANGSWGLKVNSPVGRWGGVVMFTLPFSPRWRLWRAFKRWQGKKLALGLGA